MKKDKHIGIVGGGLVGTLAAIYLARRGYRVSVYERRQDPRYNQIDGGRSINLALSNRGIKALEEVGLGDVLKQAAIPMHGRMMHDLHGKLTFQPYGKEGQYINSISRTGLNKVLIESAENHGIEFFFEQRCLRCDPFRTELTLQGAGDVLTQKTFDIILGTDGAFSSVRLSMQLTDRFDYTQDYIEHGYKEFHIPASKNGEFPFEKNALHIWPRESFMLIALPNPDGSFTGTLFFPFEGPLSFRSLQEPENFERFFSANFPDAAASIPDLLKELGENPVSSLITIKCFPWSIGNTLLLGDASHAIVPFYGQGMNAGFEDCRILNQLLEEYDDDWTVVLHRFQQLRKPDTDAIAQLALDNFTEMRDLVADEHFLLRKKIEAKIHQLFPEQWVPLYSMVTFHENIRYSEAYRIGQKQKKIMDEVMRTPNIDATWQALDFEQLARRIKED